MIRISKTDVCSISVPQDEEYLAFVRDILEASVVGEMRNYIQHGTTSCLEHSINVSYLSYLFCRSCGMNARAAARGGLLHDLFLYDWHFYRRQKGELLHGFEHPRKALENAEKAFFLTEVERDIILRHMWPLTIVPPKYPESYVIVMYDKYCSVMETFRQPVMRLEPAGVLTPRQSCP